MCIKHGERVPLYNLHHGKNQDICAGYLWAPVVIEANPSNPIYRALQGKPKNSAQIKLHYYLI